MWMIASAWFIVLAAVPYVRSLSPSVEHSHNIIVYSTERECVVGNRRIIADVYAEMGLRVHIDHLSCARQHKHPGAV